MPKITPNVLNTSAQVFASAMVNRPFDLVAAMAMHEGRKAEEFFPGRHRFLLHVLEVQNTAVPENYLTGRHDGSSVGPNRFDTVQSDCHTDYLPGSLVCRGNHGPPRHVLKPRQRLRTAALSIVATVLIVGRQIDH